MALNLPAQLRYLYPRKEGDIEVFATDRASALEILRVYGFPNLNPNKLIELDDKLENHLKKEGIR